MARQEKVSPQDALDNIFMDKDGTCETWLMMDGILIQMKLGMGEIGEIVGESGDYTAVLAQGVNSVNFVTSTTCQF